MQRTKFEEAETLQFGNWDFEKNYVTGAWSVNGGERRQNDSHLSGKELAPVPEIPRNVPLLDVSLPGQAGIEDDFGKTALVAPAGAEYFLAPHAGATAGGGEPGQIGRVPPPACVSAEGDGTAWPFEFISAGDDPNFLRVETEHAA